MLKYKRPQLKYLHDPKAIKGLFDSSKGYSYNFMQMELWSTSSPFFVINNMRTSNVIKKNPTPFPRTYSDEELNRLVKYFEVLIRINDRIKLVKQPKCKTKKTL